MVDEMSVADRAVTGGVVVQRPAEALEAGDEAAAVVAQRSRRSIGRRPLWGRRRAAAQRGPGTRADDAVGTEALGSLEALHRFLGRRAEVAVGSNWKALGCERSLQLLDRVALLPLLQCLLSHSGGPPLPSRRTRLSAR